MGVNGLDVTSLRPFDLVIPFTIKKGEITGEWGQEVAWELQRSEYASGLPDPWLCSLQGRYGCPQARWHSQPSLTTRMAL